jgi:hypothetical protein
VTTLEQLRRRYEANYITADTLLADHLPHITTLEYLRRRVREQKIDIKIGQLDPTSKRSPWVIYLHDLASWLDRQEAAAKAA